MCLGRSYNSIFQVQEEYSYPMVIGAVANPLLPDKVRSAFTQLLTHVYIDRFPHAAVRAPDPLQILEVDEQDIRGDSTSPPASGASSEHIRMPQASGGGSGGGGGGSDQVVEMTTQQKKRVLRRSSTHAGIQDAEDMQIEDPAVLRLVGKESSRELDGEKRKVHSTQFNSVLDDLNKERAAKGKGLLKPEDLEARVDKVLPRFKLPRGKVTLRLSAIYIHPTPEIDLS
jgi:hypothetical protein